MEASLDHFSDIFRLQHRDPLIIYTVFNPSTNRFVFPSESSHPTTNSVNQDRFTRKLHNAAGKRVNEERTTGAVIATEQDRLLLEDRGDASA